MTHPRSPQRFWSSYRLAAVLGLLLSLIAAPLASAETSPPAETLQAVELETLDEEIASQQTINRLDAETRRMRDDYWTLQARQQQLERQQLALETDLVRQVETLETLRQQLRRVPPDAEIDAFLRELVVALDAFVRADLPFHRETRLKRVEQLGLLLERPDVSPAERLRQILLAYQQELEYGRSIEAYDGELLGGEASASGAPALAGRADEQEGERPWVTYLRYGRVALVYQHLDGERGGFWDTGRNGPGRNGPGRNGPGRDGPAGDGPAGDVQAGRWRPLDPALNREVRRAIRIARKQMPSDLVLVPLRK